MPRISRRIPYRGQRNEPAYLVQTLEALARIRGISPSRAAEATTANAFRLFNLNSVRAGG